MVRNTLIFLKKFKVKIHFQNYKLKKVNLTLFFQKSVYSFTELQKGKGKMVSRSLWKNEQNGETMVQLKTSCQMENVTAPIRGFLPASMNFPHNNFRLSSKLRILGQLESSMASGQSSYQKTYHKKRLCTCLKCCRFQILVSPPQNGYILKAM